MDFESFYARYNGQEKVGDTPQNIGQCVGLIEVWTDYLGLSHTWGDAKDLFANADPNLFDKITNDPNDLNQFPQKGNILIFSGAFNNGAGHTGIVAQASGTTIKLFEQNDPIGSFPHLQDYNYNDVIGWLSPKVQPVTPGLPDNYAEIIKKSTAYDSVCTYLELPLATDFENTTDPAAETVKKRLDLLKQEAQKQPEAPNLPVTEINTTPGSQGSEVPQTPPLDVTPPIQPNLPVENVPEVPSVTPTEPITPSVPSLNLLYKIWDFIKGAVFYKEVKNG